MILDELGRLSRLSERLLILVSGGAPELPVEFDVEVEPLVIGLMGRWSPTAREAGALGWGRGDDPRRSRTARDGARRAARERGARDRRRRHDPRRMPGRWRPARAGGRRRREGIRTGDLPGLRAVLPGVDGSDQRQRRNRPRTVHREAIVEAHGGRSAWIATRAAARRSASACQFRPAATTKTDHHGIYSLRPTSLLMRLAGLCDNILLGVRIQSQGAVEIRLGPGREGLRDTSQKPFHIMIGNHKPRSRSFAAPSRSCRGPTRAIDGSF